jgi:hypothetical protein
MRVGCPTAFRSMARGGSKIRVMRALRFHSNLLATGAVLVLISVPAVSLDSGLAFVGTVTDRFQKPVPTAVATLSSIDRVLQTHVSADGQFRFENVPPGVYDLETKAHGFVRQRAAVDLSGADLSGAKAPPLAIVLQLQTSVPDIEECLPQDSIVYSSFDSKRPQLDGIVRSYDKRKPLGRAEVTLARVDDPQITSRTRSDDHGRFQFESLAAGRYNLRISVHGYLLPEPKQLLVPRENNVTVDTSLVRDDKKLIVCQ